MDSTQAAKLKELSQRVKELESELEKYQVNGYTHTHTHTHIVPHFVACTLYVCTCETVELNYQPINHPQVGDSDQIALYSIKTTTPSPNDVKISDSTEI